MRKLCAAIAILALAEAGCNQESKSTPASTHSAPARAETVAPVQQNGNQNSTTSSALVAPRQLEPSDGATLDRFPRKTQLIWAPVAGAANYKVEVEFEDSGKWVSHPNGKETGPTEREVEFIGAQPGRWRVWAVDSEGHEGPKSAWWTFRYTK